MATRALHAVFSTVVQLSWTISQQEALLSPSRQAASHVKSQAVPAQATSHRQEGDLVAILQFSKGCLGEESDTIWIEFGGDLSANLRKLTSWLGEPATSTFFNDFLRRILHVHAQVEEVNHVKYLSDQYLVTAMDLKLLLGLASLALAIILPALLFSDELLYWIRVKKYRYESTFALTMMTPRERFIVNSIVFLMLSMFIIAASLYLPEHIVTMTHRAFYYWSGKTKTSAALSAAATDTIKNITSQAAATATSIVNAATEMVKGSVVDASAGGSTPIEAVPVGGMGL